MKITIGIGLAPFGLSGISHRALVNTASGEVAYETTGGAMVIASVASINRILGA